MLPRPPAQEAGRSAARSRAVSPVVLAALLGLAAALPYLGGGPVWDDHTLIVERLAKLDGAGVAGLWTRPVGGGDAGGAYFRPVAVTALALLGRHGMVAIHLLTAVLHAVSAGLLCALCGRDRLALVAAGVFAVHPICAEVLGWASALPDALSVLFGLLGLGWARRGRAWPAVVGLFALSVLSKEAGVVWPLVGVVTGWLDRRAALASGLAVAGLLGLRPLLGVHAVAPVSLVPAELVAAPLSQLGALIGPLPLSAVRDTHHLGAGRVALGALLVVAGALGALRVGRAFAGPALGMVAGPVLALPTVMSSHLAADRYVYLSVACLALMIGALPRSTRLGAALETPAVRLALGVAALAGIAVHGTAATMWQSDVRLFEQAVEVSPESSYAHYFAGHAAAKAGQWPAAAQHFQSSSTLSHPHPLGARFALEALVRGGAAAAAVAFARSQPREGLTADWLAWWARAELDAGHPDRSLALVARLRRPDGSWDGPDFVPALAEAARKRALDASVPAD